MPLKLKNINGSGNAKLSTERSNDHYRNRRESDQRCWVKTVTTGRRHSHAATTNVVIFNLSLGHCAKRNFGYTSQADCFYHNVAFAWMNTRVLKSLKTKKLKFNKTCARRRADYLKMIKYIATIYNNFGKATSSALQKSSKKGKSLNFGKVVDKILIYCDSNFSVTFNFQTVQLSVHWYKGLWFVQSCK